MDLVAFIISMIVVVALWGLYSLRSVNKLEYFKTSTGLGILKGIVLAVLFSIGVGLASYAIADEPKWFPTAEVYAGIDQTFDNSPMCVKGSVDDQATSNLGIDITIYEYNNFSIASKYTHHSCAFGEDSEGYDGIGVVLRYKLW